MRFGTMTERRRACLQGIGALAVLFFVLPSPAAAQDAYTFTALEPDQIQIASFPAGGAFFSSTQTPAVGSLRVSATLSSDDRVTASGTIGMTAPPSATGFLGTGVLPNFAFTAPLSFSVNTALSGVRQLHITATTAVQVKETFNEEPTLPLSLTSIRYDPDLLIAFLPVIVDFKLPAAPNSTANTPSYVRVSLRFRWRMAPFCPAADEIAGTPRRAICPPPGVDAITLNLAVPKASNGIFATADLLPAFCGAGTYTFTGTNQAQIVLRLLDSTGFAVAVSAPKKVAPGTNQKWGGGCWGQQDLVFIPDTFKMPQFFFPVNAAANEVLGNLRLQARIEDSVNQSHQAVSNTFDYPVMPGVSLANTKFVLTDRHHTGRQPLDILSPSRPLSPPGLLGDLLGAAEFGTDSWNASLETQVDFAGSSATLNVELTSFDLAGTLLKSTFSSPSGPIENGRATYRVDLFEDIAYTASTIAIQPQVKLRTGQIVRFTPIIIPANSIEILNLSPDPSACTDKAPPTSCLLSGAANRMDFDLKVTPTVPDTRIVRSISLRNTKTPGVLLDVILPDQLPVGKRTLIVDTIPALTLPEDVESVRVAYHLLLPGDPERCTYRCAYDVRGYNKFTSPGAVLAAAGINAIQNLNSATLTVLQTSINKKVRDIKSTLALASMAISFKNDAKKYWDNLPATVNNPAFIGIASTWQFDSPVPRDGSLSARLSLSWADAQLPDDPNFVLTRLQVVSLDASGVLRSYPTTLDLVNRTATAQIDSLDPYYSLAVLGPFQNSSVALPPALTGSALVNTGAQDASLSVTAFDQSGTGTAATSVVKPGNLIKPGPAGWVSATSASSAVRGVSWFNSGSLLAVSPAVTPGLVFAVTDVEYSGSKNTELRWANATNFPAATRVTLYNADGTVRGKTEVALAPKASVSARINSLFPTLPKNFVGYAVLASNQPLVASGAQYTNTTATGIAAQPMTDANLDIVTRFGTRLGESEGVATLHLVNLGSATAKVTLRARTSAGAAAGSNASVDIAAGTQYTRALNEIFNVPADSIGSLQMDSTTSSVLGDLFTADANFIPTYGTSIPLSADVQTSAVLPFATSGTAVYIFNPNSVAANVSATAYGIDGAKGGTSITTVPAFGRGSVQVSAASNGYVGIASSQPIAATGFLTTENAAVSGYLALASAAVAVAPSGAGTKPTGSAAGVVNAGSYKGGTIAPGEIVTIFGANFGSALTKLTLLSNGRVATELSETRFLFDNVAAPMVYVVSGQASVVAPYSIAGKSTTQMVIEYQGRRSDPITLTVGPAVPGLFAADSSGSGPGAILNQDYKVNTAQNPAKRGAIVILYGTGEGSTTPTVADGSVTAAVVQPDLAVSVTIGGVAQKVLYAGAAPSLVAGVLQVNVEIAASTPTGNQPVIVTVGEASSQTGLTVAIAQ
ncbi:MAG: hypothetical protein ABI811_23000 [Acidobacteriota bacterium]